MNVNDLISWPQLNGPPKIERILALGPSPAQAVTIEVTDKLAWPVERDRVELVQAFADGTAMLLSNDPFRPFVDDVHVSTQVRQHRDTCWAALEPLIKLHGTALFDPHVRGQAISEAEKATKRSRKYFVRDLRRYWQGGQIPDALIPHWGLTKAIARVGPPKKRGRPRGRLKDRPDTRSPIIGMNISEEMAKQLAAGVRHFHETEHYSLRKAYKATLNLSFAERYEMRGGIVTPVLPSDPNLIPTFTQSVYWYEKARDFPKALAATEGARKFALRHRALLGDTGRLAWGPGSLYQIDATVGDIDLVSSFNPHHLIGKPVLYFVMDVFSRMIAGFAVLLEGPSWVGAMEALACAALDKVALCAEYGISIAPEWWPCVGLPDGLLADRGELEGPIADNTVKAFGWDLSNTPPYRGDFKGVIEQNFHVQNEAGIKWVPGATRPIRERGERDTRLDACMTLRGFRELIIRLILRHNRNHRMNWYQRSDFAIEDGVQPYPVNLWHWGTANRTGHLRTFPPSYVRLHLLPGGQATVTESGIQFRGLSYSCERAVHEGWFVRARARGRWHINVAYDPRVTGTIYLRLRGAQELEPCYLLERDEKYRAWDWYDLEENRALEGHAADLAELPDLQGEAESDAAIDALVTKAKARKAAFPKPSTKSERLGSVREHRDRERQQDQQQSAWVPPTPAPAEVPDDPNEELDSGVDPQQRYLEIISRTFEEKQRA